MDMTATATERATGMKAVVRAEYVCVRMGVARKPSNLTFEEAAAVPVAALTALQRPARPRTASGGTKSPRQRRLWGCRHVCRADREALGAEVTAVCSTRNVEHARSLGADHVIDYTAEDFARSGRRYDVILDVAGSKSWSQCRRVLNPHATLVIVGGPTSEELGARLSQLSRRDDAAAEGRHLIRVERRPGELLAQVERSAQVHDVAHPLVGVRPVPRAAVVGLRRDRLEPRQQLL